MSDGTPVPVAHDGMGAFEAQGRRRCSSATTRSAPAGDRAGSAHTPGDAKYDQLGVGGTTTLLFDTGGASWRALGELRRLDRQLRRRHRVQGRRLDHLRGDRRRPQPGLGTEARLQLPRHCRPPLGPVAPALTAMGRFAHEAVAIDPRTGIVYQTEDDGNDSGLYRFLPATRVTSAGGTLEMLAIAGQPQRSMITGQQVGLAFPVQWVPIDDPDPDLEGGATPRRAPGHRPGCRTVQPARGHLVRPVRPAASTSTPPAAETPATGQVWHYSPAGGAHPVLRVARRVGARLPGQPSGDPAGRRSAVRGRRQRRRQRHTPARPRHRGRQPPHRHQPRRARRSSSPSTF